MNPNINIPYSSYVDGVRVGALYVPVVARQLLNRAPGDLGTEGKKALRVVVAVSDEVQDVRGERTGQSNARVAEPRAALLTAYLAMHGSLTAKGDLGGKQAARAIEIRIAYLGDDKIGRADAQAVWTIADGALRKIDAAGIGGEIDSLIGPDYLATLRERTRTLGEAIGVGRTVHESIDSTKMRAALRRFTKATSKYFRLLAAEVDEESEESVDRFLKAVSPIDEYRASVRASGVSEDEDEGEQPAPAPAPNGGETPAS